jgi:hypothetical protein
VRNISLKVNTKWLKTTLKIPNISAHNFGGNSGVPVNEIGKVIIYDKSSETGKVLIYDKSSETGKVLIYDT